MKRICVFAGSNSGATVEYVAAARDLGRVLAQRQLGVVGRTHGRPCARGLVGGAAELRVWAGSMAA